jgi:hypothetical protein
MLAGLKMATSLEDAVRETRRERNRAAAKRHAQVAAYMREILIEAMGGVCACGCGTVRYDLLEFDHHHGRKWVANRLSKVRRMQRYVRDFLDGNLRLLCRESNRRDGGARRWDRNEVTMSRRYADAKAEVVALRARIAELEAEVVKLRGLHAV